ncbi:DEAD-box ATP-dependent RNA helicase 38 [Cryptomeria japonica]|uniref:DEAD-box ATP-dependent RNA helicase 38 n=1 Tax=Cryptomeria japonica TaxID=3369 RepID=UPI0025AC0FB7|nr:DEAD-box ATP-dependent RNA helicase 38 [Cryptomeria japonica]
MAEDGKEKIMMNREETLMEQKKDSTENENSNKDKSVETKVVEKKRWGDEELDDDKVSDAVDVINSININEAATVDEPEIILKSDKLIEPAHSDESHIKAVTAGDTPYTSAKTFEDLNLSPELLRGLYSEMGFEKPSKIQAVTLPMIIRPPHQNLIAQAHNGSGKTTCFVLGMLSRVNPSINAPQALCVCPTRELAMQNQEVLLKMGKHTSITSACAVPTDAASYVKRREPFTEHVVIGTPGTLKKWMTAKVLSMRYISILVFDEADHMLAQDGFRDDSMRIIKDIQKNRGDLQILLFSATFDENVKQFATRVISNPNQVFVKKEELSLDVIKQYRVKCPDKLAKVQVLKDRIFPLAEKLGQSIIFVRTRESASMLHNQLEAEGYKCTSIQGGLKLEDRDLVIKEFRMGLTKILIATDVLARGFDQAQVTLVVNFDLPTKHMPPHDPDYEVYLHRIGRSGRFGRKGAAFNFLTDERDEQTMKKIERHFQREVPEVPWDDEEAFETVLKDAGLA